MYVGDRHDCGMVEQRKWKLASSGGEWDDGRISRGQSSADQASWDGRLMLAGDKRMFPVPDATGVKRAWTSVGP